MSARFDQPQTADLYALLAAFAGIAAIGWALRKRNRP